MINNDVKILGIFIAALAGVYGWLLKHVSSKRHVSSESVVYKDVCSEITKRIEHSLSDAIERSDDHYKSLEKSIDEVKELIRNGRK